MEIDKALKTLGIGLSRVLRYSYGGFLVVAFGSVVNPPGMQIILKTISWELTALSALVIGAGIYAAHRSVVIPIHHLTLSGVFRFLEFVGQTQANATCSPTRWLASIGVRRFRRMYGYSTLRRSNFLPEHERERLDIAHAENGLVVMTAEGLFAAAWYASIYPENSLVGPWPLSVLGLMFWVASYPGALEQHSLECMHWRTRADDARIVLRSFGVL